MYSTSLLEDIYKDFLGFLITQILDEEFKFLINAFFFIPFNRATQLGDLK